MWKIALGLNGFSRGEETEEILEHASNLGFNGVELMPFHVDYSTKPEKRRELRQRFLDVGLEVPALQSHPGSLPAHPDRAIRREYIRSAAEDMGFARDVGASVVGVWSGGRIPSMKRGYPPSLLEEWLVETYGELCDVAEESGILLCTEPEPSIIINSLETLLGVIEGVGSDSFKALYDFSHANVLSNSNPLAWVKALSGRIGWLHVTDNDGTEWHGTSRHLAIGEGKLNVEEILRAIMGAGYESDWLDIDVWDHPDPFTAAEKSKKALDAILVKLSR